MYLARMVLRGCMYLSPLFMALICVRTMLKRRQRIIVKQSLRNFLRALPLIIAASALYLGICMGYRLIDGKLSARVKLGYDYMQASKGLTPNNTKLDTLEILNDEVIDKAIAEGGFELLMPDELRETLSIKNLKEKDSVSPENYYLSTEYTINYEASNKSYVYDSNSVVEAVANAYRDFFINKYSRKLNIISIDYSEMESMDYLDIYTYLNRRLSNIVDYMKMCESENPTFMSGRTSESFRSLKEKAQNYRSVALERYKAYVLKNGLSKNSRQYIDKLNYINKVTSVEYMKNLAAYGVRLAAIDKYERDIVTAVLVPSRDSKGEYYQSRTKIGTDYFAKDASDYLEYATEKQLRIEENNYNIVQLSQAAPTSENFQKADVMIAELQGQIKELSDAAVKTVEDYDKEVCRNYINLSYRENSDVLKSAIKKSVAYAALFFFLLMMTAFLHERKEKRV